MLLISIYLLYDFHLNTNQIFSIICPYFNDHPTFYVDCVSKHGGYITRLRDCVLVMENNFRNVIVDVSTFDFEDYLYCLKDDYYNMTMIPHRLIAMVCPTQNNIVNVKKELVKRGVKHIIQLNDDIEYNKDIFKEDIEHHSMVFEDCTHPSKTILDEYLNLIKKTEKNNEKIAIHCKAGLGRTGIFVCVYLIVKLRIPAKQAIAMLRIWRPGSIMGYQGHYLETIEDMLLDIDMGE